MGNIYVCMNISRQSLSVYHRLALNFQSSRFSLPSAGTVRVYYYSHPHRMPVFVV